MRKVIISLLFMILFISFATADVIITEQPKELYSLGDTINIPVKITTLTDINKLFTIDLICNGIQEEIFKEYLSLSAGEEATRNPNVPLTENLIGRPDGTCVIKANLGAEIFKLTNDFSISNFIDIKLKSEISETAPEQQIIITGDAIKDNGQATQGVIELKVIRDNSTIIDIIDTVKNGYFFLNFSFPKEAKAGKYLVSIDIYENDLEGTTTNKGFINYNLLVTQVPTSLEIIFDEINVEPGTNLKIKTILHDQTGEPIESSSIITLKNNNNEILEQTDKKTGEFLEFPIMYNEPTAEWEVVAVSNKLTSEANFNIIEKENIDIFLVNRTITISNKGNIPYCNKSVLIKINEESIIVPVCLEVDEEQEYLLTAPEGEYQVEIISEGEEKISQSVMLTGRSIDVKEISRSNFIKYPFIWIFIIGILGFVAFLFFKKGYKKSFFGYLSRKRNRKDTLVLGGGKSLLNTRNKAELSLSIKGEKQNISLVCLKIKNLEALQSKKSSTENTLQEIIEIVEEKKGATYENNDNLFFLLAPVKTKTFGNERTAIEIAQKTKAMLEGHNKLMKDKIDFGISLNYGTIIAKQEKDVLKFMSMGTLITTAKKLANASNKEILLGEKINDRLRTEVKTEKQTHGNTIAYSIKEIKNKKDHSNFLSNFVKKLERDKQEKKERDEKAAKEDKD